MSILQEDGAGLDYRNQAGVPDHQRYFDAWTADSERAREELDCVLDVPYGDGWRETCDVFPASRPGGGKAPVFIFIHGGWFYFLDKADFSYLAPAYVRNGVVVVNIAYPLAPQARIGDIVRSVAKAVSWVRANIARYGGDPDRISIGGHSAGGHLATMMTLRDWTPDGAPRGVIRTCCSVSGLYDLIPILDTPHNEKIGMTRQDAEENSPITRLARRDSKMILSVGGAELSGFHWQHRKFTESARWAGLEVVDASIPGRHHFSIIDELGKTDSPLFRTMLQAIG